MVKKEITTLTKEGVFVPYDEKLAAEWKRLGYLNVKIDIRAIIQGVADRFGSS